MICSALHCDVQYFIDSDVRNCDLLISTMNRGKDSVKSRNVKAKIQDFMNLSSEEWLNKIGYETE